MALVVVIVELDLHIALGGEPASQLAGIAAVPGFGVWGCLGPRLPAEEPGRRVVVEEFAEPFGRQGRSGLTCNPCGLIFMALQSSNSLVRLFGGLSWALVQVT